LYGNDYEHAYHIVIVLVWNEYTNVSLRTAAELSWITRQQPSMQSM